MPRPISATFDLAAFARNLVVAHARAPGARIWAVVKANAYGHGLLRAVRALDAADGFALLDLDDAVRLRDAGVRKPVLLLEGFFATADLEVIAAHSLSVVVHSQEQIAMLETARLPARLSVLLKLNTGMNRLGLPPEEARRAVERLKACACVAEIGLMTHFADADGPAGVAEQLARFELATAGLALPRCLANSAALLRYPQARGDWVRPGIMLYGCSPFADEPAAALGLEPVMTLTAELIAVRQIAAGDCVGYGGTFRADRAMRIGVVACGYADGYPRHAPTGTPVLVAGRRTRTVGRVSMDMLTVDLEPIPEAAVGTAVTLWGQGLSCDDVAAAAGTVSYELLCALAARVPQVERAH
jgi:alanine racemase